MLKTKEQGNLCVATVDLQSVQVVDVDGRNQSETLSAEGRLDVVATIKDDISKHKLIRAQYPIDIKQKIHDSKINPDDYVFFTSRAIDAGGIEDDRIAVTSSGRIVKELHGANDNGDYFTENELLKITTKDGKQIKAFETFVGCPVFTNHNNQNIEEARGQILDAMYDLDNHAVYVTAMIDKKSYPQLARGIEQEYITDVSMGCAVEFSVCSECGNKAHTEREYCECVKSKKGRIINGKRIYERNYGLKFIELSCVTDGAAPNCTIQSIIPSSEVMSKISELSSRLATNNMQRVASGGIDNSKETTLLLEELLDTINQARIAMVGDNKSLVKTASKQDLVNLNGALKTLKGVSKQMLDSENMDYEFLEDLAKVLAQLQKLIVDLADAGWGTEGGDELSNDEPMPTGEGGQEEAGEESILPQNQPNLSIPQSQPQNAEVSPYDNASPLAADTTDKLKKVAEDVVKSIVKADVKKGFDNESSERKKHHTGGYIEETIMNNSYSVAKNGMMVKFANNKFTATKNDSQIFEVGVNKLTSDMLDKTPVQVAKSMLNEMLITASAQQYEYNELKSIAEGLCPNCSSQLSQSQTFPDKSACLKCSELFDITPEEADIKVREHQEHQELMREPDINEQLEYIDKAKKGRGDVLPRDIRRKKIDKEIQKELRKLLGSEEKYQEYLDIVKMYANAKAVTPLKKTALLDDYSDQELQSIADGLCPQCSNPLSKSIAYPGEAICTQCMDSYDIMPATAEAILDKRKEFTIQDQLSGLENSKTRKFEEDFSFANSNKMKKMASWKDLSIDELESIGRGRCPRCYGSLSESPSYPDSAICVNCIEVFDITPDKAQRAADALLNNAEYDSTDDAMDAYDNDIDVARTMTDRKYKAFAKSDKMKKTAQTGNDNANIVKFVDKRSIATCSDCGGKTTEFNNGQKSVCNKCGREQTLTQMQAIDMLKKIRPDDFKMSTGKDKPDHIYVDLKSGSDDDYDDDDDYIDPDDEDFDKHYTLKDEFTDKFEEYDDNKHYPGRFGRLNKALNIQSELEKNAKKTNPWAVCNATVDKDKDPEKYERCVQEVKKQRDK